MNLILCGMQKSGKTTTGKALAEALHSPFVDVDRLIEKISGEELSCREICKQRGEVFFRTLEKKALESLQSVQESVIALGGGSCLDAVRNLGTIIYLKVPVDILWERMAREELPSYLDPHFPKESFYALAKKRFPLYEKAADLILDTELENSTPWQAILLALSLK